MLQCVGWLDPSYTVGHNKRATMFFSAVHISQAVVATQLTCGGTFNNRVTANFPHNVQ